MKSYLNFTKNVNPYLKNYIETSIFPEYEKNDKGHGILHILEVIRRAFELNNLLKLNLDENIIYTISACHDNGKYINHEIHEKIAAERFFQNEKFKDFFTDEERLIIKEAIEDHRSSHNQNPRSNYGKLISSADRNSTIEIVFIRSFFVGQDRTPDMIIEDFLDFTLNRLRKRYSNDNPENMFYSDEKYEKFLKDMRKLLSNEHEFKKQYCAINQIKNRTKKLIEEKGVII
ncbi:MAG: HD domain-containing protein [Clostridia bacterium]|nr:HD domain-containing protein [Clostridia bacterium]